MAERIQLKRVKGFCLPPGAVSVARPTKWGNPFTIAGAVAGGFASTQAEGRGVAVAFFRRWLADLDPAEHDVYYIGGVGSQPYDRRWMRDHLAELAGKDLACWCPLPAEGEPDICHAAVLLEMANA